MAVSALSYIPAIANLDKVTCVHMCDDDDDDDDDDVYLEYYSGPTFHTHSFNPLPIPITTPQPLTL
jgi:hypothetical protein